MHKIPDFETILFLTAISPLSNYYHEKSQVVKSNFNYIRNITQKMKAIMSSVGLHINAETPSKSLLHSLLADSTNLRIR